MLQQAVQSVCGVSLHPLRYSKGDWTCSKQAALGDLALTKEAGTKQSLEVPPCFNWFVILSFLSLPHPFQRYCLTVSHISAGLLRDAGTVKGVWRCYLMLWSKSQQHRVR